MQPIEFSYDVEHRFDATKEEVGSHFRDVENIARCTSDVETCIRVGEGTYAWTLVEKRELGLSFQPKYVMNYVWEAADRLHWTTLGFEDKSNTSIFGTVAFIADTDESCIVRVSERIAFDLPISLITAKIVKAIARRESLSEMRSVLSRMNSLLTVNRHAS
ncbi:MAG: hypothetical protein ACOY82_03330 [Pseudomonadota bacterium]